VLPETEQLIKAVWYRINEFERGNQGPLMADAAHDEVLLLLSGANQFALDDQATSMVLPAPVIVPVAWYYWYRYRHRGLAEDYQTATALFGAMQEVAPDQIPPELAPRLLADADGDAAARQAEVAGWLDQAADLVERSRATHEATASVRQLDRAIELFQRVRDIPSREIGDIDRYLPSCLSNLGAALALRYSLAGQPDDLDQAIKSARAAVALVPGEDNPRRAMYLSNLNNMLQRRHDAFGMRDDIDEAITQQRIAMDLTGRGDPHWSRFTGLLVSLLNSRFADTGGIGDITEAIQLGEELFSPADRDDPHRLANAANLAGCYATRYQHEMRTQREPRLADLDRGVELGEWVVQRTPTEDTDLPGVLSNLAETLHQRFGRTGRVADIKRAIDYAGRAATGTGPADPDRVAFLLNLGGAWCDYARFGDGGAAATRSAVAVLTEAMRITSAPARTRLSAARLCGECAGKIADWDSAIAAYRVAVRLLPRIAWRGVDRATGERLLAGADGLAGVAAAHAIMAGRPEEAVELLEFGRSVLWSQMLANDVDLGRLRELAPQLAEQLTELDAELDWIERTGAASRDRRYADRRVRTAHRRTELTSQAQDILGREQAPPAAGFAQLRGAARNGPVVLINTSPWRCDALIVGSGGVRLLPLRGLEPADIGDNIDRFFGAMDTAIGHWHDRAAEETLADVLAWLWDSTAEPVLRELGHTGPPAPGAAYPRVWWCPIGPLSFLPLHAAGHHASGGRDSVLDRVVSSYAPNLQSLTGVGQRPTGPPARPLLVVRTLSNDSPERWIPGYPATVLSGADATPQRVREALPYHAYVHVSAHASQDVTDPSAGFIELNGGHLRLGDVRPGQYPNGRFAFLSACETATGGTDLPDEMITLATAFQYAGFDHVIGTTWPVFDNVAIKVEQRVYQELVQADGLRPERAPAALRAAIATERDLRPDRPSRWLPFMHAGR
jgi:tetratricopeptide (TPR) repeat protein